jgi:predicted transcriptional regulator of viral defense system
MRKPTLVNKLASMGETFTFGDARENCNLTYGSLKNLLYRLETDGWIERIEKGKYIIIPLGSEKGKYTLNEFVIGSMLVEPYCISYWSALHYYGFTEQIPSTVFMQTTSRKKHQNIDVFGVRYKIIRVMENKFFGIDRVWFNDFQISISDREKTVIDCLDRPQNCGGLIEVIKAIKNESLDWKKISEYAGRISNTGVIRRLGFISEYYGIHGLELPEIDTRNYLLLDPGHPVTGVGKKSSKWRLIINMREKDLENIE